jgi:hypothetical protein
MGLGLVLPFPKAARKRALRIKIRSVDMIAIKIEG